MFFPSHLVLLSFHKATISCTCDVGHDWDPVCDPNVWNGGFRLRFPTSFRQIFQWSHFQKCARGPEFFLGKTVGNNALFSCYHLYCILAGQPKKRKCPTWKQMSRPSKVLGKSGDFPPTGHMNIKLTKITLYTLVYINENQHGWFEAFAAIFFRKVSFSSHVFLVTNEDSRLGIRDGPMEYQIGATGSFWIDKLNSAKKNSTYKFCFKKKWSRINESKNILGLLVKKMLQSE